MTSIGMLLAISVEIIVTLLEKSFESFFIFGLSVTTNRSSSGLTAKKLKSAYPDFVINRTGKGLKSLSDFQMIGNFLFPMGARPVCLNSKGFFRNCF